MIYKFKFYGHYFAFDTTSRAVHKLSDIQYDMLTYLRFPLEEIFPTTLRYDLAKYESSQLKEAYFEFKKLCDDGVFMSDAPVLLHETERKLADAQMTVKYDAKKFVFASEIIKNADNGCNILSAEEDTLAPVKESDYDILFSEYDRIAKELIKRKSGRIEGKTFEFLPFSLSFEKDEKGYFHIMDKGISEIFESGKETVSRKCAELAIAVFLE